MVKWEYLHLDVPTKGLIGVSLPEYFVDKLNQLGQEGWEVVLAAPLAVGAGMTARVCFLLKRPVQ
jgi:hypothetical protein